MKSKKEIRKYLEHRKVVFKTLLTKYTDSLKKGVYKNLTREGFDKLDKLQTEINMLNWILDDK